MAASRAAPVCYDARSVTRYELVDRIGVGGIAEIFRGKAFAAQGFEKPVAIKRILPHLSQDRRFVELLIAEAKVLSLLKHRNIVQVFDVGLGDDGQYFLVMEFVDGKDLGTIQRAYHVARRPIAFDLVLHIGAEICEALEHAHGSRGPDGKAMTLVHRDVSPSNVLVSRAGEVKLTDFGIAKRADHDTTQVGPMRGKFAYISPEQAQNEHLDPRSDVFSVGILMWELLCNRPLFSHLDDAAALRAIRQGDIAKPTDLDTRLPPEIDAIIMGALARDKAHRHPTAEAFGTRLRALRYSLDGSTVDPAAELAKIVDSTNDVRPAVTRPKPVSAVPNEFDAPESTVIRIRTAAEFSARHDNGSISAARQVIDRFEEQETRLASLSPQQMQRLNAIPSHDSVELAEGTTPGESPALRPLAPSDELTRSLDRAGLVVGGLAQGDAIAAAPPHALRRMVGGGGSAVAPGARGKSPTGDDPRTSLIKISTGVIDRIPWVLVAVAVLLAVTSFAVTRALLR